MTHESMSQNHQPERGSRSSINLQLQRRAVKRVPKEIEDTAVMDYRPAEGWFSTGKGFLDTPLLAQTRNERTRKNHNDSALQTVQVDSDSQANPQREALEETLTLQRMEEEKPDYDMESLSITLGGAGINPKSKKAKRLQYGNQAIELTKRLLPLGAGNQIEHVLQTHGKSSCRVVIGRSLQRAQANTPFMKIAQDAIHGLVVGAGNCGEHSAIAFCYLWEYLKDELVTAVLHSVDHCFVVIGNYFTEPASEIVIVDAWPTKATICTLDQFTFSQTNKWDVQCQGKAGGHNLVSMFWKTVKTDEFYDMMAVDTEELTENQKQYIRDNMRELRIYDHISSLLGQF